MKTPRTARRSPTPTASTDPKDSGARVAVVWPDPSPLSSWWQEIMELPAT
ncbi:hypothetical protein [Nocardia stercoris]|nr:hypothetical protein [Nocardia stercoris]